MKIYSHNSVNNNQFNYRTCQISANNIIKYYAYVLYNDQKKPSTLLNCTLIKTF